MQRCRHSFRVVRLLWLLMLGLAWPGMRAQSPLAGPNTFSLVTDRAPVVSLVGDWRFAPGDDPSYRLPAFDDSNWKLLRSNESWTTQGFDRWRGYGWYRFQVVLPAGSQSFGLLLPPMANAFEVFLDGARAGSVGVLGQDGQLRTLRPSIWDLPAGIRAAPRTVLVALRVWSSTRADSSSHGGGPVPGNEEMMRVGPTREVTRFLAINNGLIRERATSMLILAGVNLLAAIIAFALFFIRPQQREYLWFGITTLAWGIGSGLHYATAGKSLRISVIELTFEGLEMAATLALIAFYRRLLAERVTWQVRVAVAGVLLQLVPMALVLVRGPAGLDLTEIWLLVLDLPFELWVLGLLVRRARAGRLEGRLLLAPALLLFVLEGLDGAIQLVGMLGFPLHFHINDLAISWPVPVMPSDLGTLLFLLAMLAVLIARFAGTSREQDRVSGELEAARSVQQVLIPDTPPVTPGLGIASAYYPAQEVSGDFFQILPLPGHSTLIVLGDVSGKGLSAAMTVSLVVGALRTLAEFTASPAVLLAGLNRRLYGRGTGFTTCLALRISAAGEVVLANAGHLPPYRNGHELATTPSLPLGLDLGAHFDEQSFHLVSGDRLTLLTDGVVEATSHSGPKAELFGFERTERLSMEPAAVIAQTARSFGQTDDITVLSIYFASAADSAQPTPGAA